MRVLLIFMLIVFARVAFAADECSGAFTPEKKEEPARAQAHPYRKFKAEIAGPPRITLLNFSGMKSFQHARSADYFPEGGAFKFCEGGLCDHQRDGFRDDESYIADLQNFALSKMNETGYLTPEEKRMFSQLGASFHTSQINFFMVSRDATEAEIAKYPRELLDSRYAADFRHDHPYANGLTPVRTATMWSVAGQLIDSNTHKMKPVQLPWEKEEARRGQALDRTKYKYVWEWGRAAQDIAEEISPIYSANAAMNFIDLLAHGGSLKDAYVMFHSFDPVNTRYYLSEHPDSTYPPGWKDPKDSLFLVPLADMLKRYPPSRFSHRVAEIVRRSKGKIDEINALTLLVINRQYRWTEFDLVGIQHQTSPILMDDESIAYLWNLQLALENFGLTTDEVRDTAEILAASYPVVHTTNTNGKYNNATDSAATEHFTKQHNAIDITNLDPAIARRDPNFVQTIIFESYVAAVNRMAHSVMARHRDYSFERAKAESINMFMQQGVNFSISTPYKEIAEQAERLHPIAKDVQPGTDRNGIPERDTATMPPYWFNDVHTYVFSMQHILTWARTHTNMHASPNYQLQLDFWWRQYFLSQAELL